MPIQVGTDEFEIPSKEAVAITEGLERVADRLGRPIDASTESGWKMIDNLVGVWYNFYPWELKAWKKELAIQLGTERTVHEALKASGGHIPISFPTRLYKMIETYMPQVRFQDKAFIKKFAGRYPIFKFTNAKL